MDSHNGCAGDAGWLVMISQIADDGQCPWERSHGPLPVFMYSKKSTRAIWNDGYDAGKKQFKIEVFLIQIINLTHLTHITSF